MKKMDKILSKSIECFYYNKNEQIPKKEQKSDNYEINLIKAQKSKITLFGVYVKLDESNEIIISINL